MLLKVIKPNSLKLIFDQCGNHVIQRMMDLVPRESTEFLVYIIETNVYISKSKKVFKVENIVSHSYGCRIAQKCLEIYSNDRVIYY